MNKENVKTWVNALRSGEYEQTTEHLCEVDDIDGTTGYCCLGVACDLFVDGYWVEHNESNAWGGAGRWSIGELKEWEAKEHGVGHVVEFDNTSFPTLDMLELMGLDPGYAEKLAKLNDRGWSFAKIANKIERDLL